MKNIQIPNRLYSIDVLRGIASLCVVLCHWELLVAFTTAQSVNLSNLPFAKVLLLIYTDGNAAVNLFFCISGFIFFWLYSKKIAESKISFKDFSILRLSRLYPLHFFTLLLVTIGQLYLINIHGDHFGFHFGTTGDFLMNLLFISAWMSPNPNFNGPVWSVSVEVFLYIAFFVFCKKLPIKLFLMLALSLFGHFILVKFSPALGEGVESFFLGGCTYLIFERIVKSNHTFNIASRLLPAITIILWVLSLIYIGPNNPFDKPAMPFVIEKLFQYWFIFIVFPATVLSLALYEVKVKSFGKKLAFLGDISYSTYLLHFPLLLLVAIMFTQFELSPNMTYSGWLLIAYFLVLITISLLSFRYVEMPIQKVLRLKFMPKRQKT